MVSTHEFNKIGVGRIRMLPFSSDSTCNSFAYDPAVFSREDNWFSQVDKTFLNLNFSDTKLSSR